MCFPLITCYIVEPKTPMGMALNSLLKNLGDGLGDGFIFQSGL